MIDCTESRGLGGLREGYFAVAQFTVHELSHLWNDEHVDFLTCADATHTIGPLHIVSEDHVLT